MADQPRECGLDGSHMTIAQSDLTTSALWGVGRAVAAGTPTGAVAALIRTDLLAAAAAAAAAGAIETLAAAAADPVAAAVATATIFSSFAADCAGRYERDRARGCRRTG